MKYERGYTLHTCTVLHRITLYYTVLHCITPYYIVYASKTLLVVLFTPQKTLLVELRTRFTKANMFAYNYDLIKCLFREFVFE